MSKEREEAAVEFADRIRSPSFIDSGCLQDTAEHAFKAGWDAAEKHLAERSEYEMVAGEIRVASMTCPKCKAWWYPWRPCCGHPPPKGWAE